MIYRFVLSVALLTPVLAFSASQSTVYSVGHDIRHLPADKGTIGNFFNHLYHPDQAKPPLVTGHDHASMKKIAQKPQKPNITHATVLGRQSETALRVHSKTDLLARPARSADLDRIQKMPIKAEHSTQPQMVKKSMAAPTQSVPLLKMRMRD